MSLFKSVRTQVKETWARIHFSEEDLQVILGLYEKYRDSLESVIREQRVFFNRRYQIGMVPQLGDLEAEITYLRIRDCRPAIVVEISPASGWSTSWILHALKDNRSGRLFSYGVIDDSTRTIPRRLSKGRWQFYKGDVRDNMGLLPVDADYLFIDSDHSAEFAHWYIVNLFPLVKKGTKASAHDILKWPEEPGWGEGSLVLCSWLVKKGIGCVTSSRALKEKGYSMIVEMRSRLGFGNFIQQADHNPMIFFSL